MNEFLSVLLRLVVQLVLVAVGVVFFLSVLAVAALLALVWALRYGWAKLTGKPVTPWAMKMSPRSGFTTVFRSSERWTGRARPGYPGQNMQDLDDVQPAAPRHGGVLPHATDVTDVEAREVR